MFEGDMPQRRGMEVLETPRLRQWHASDREPFAEMGRDAQVMAYFPALMTRAQSDAMALRCAQLIAERGWGLWAVELYPERVFIGSIGLHEPAANLPFAPCVEVGWRLARPYWGKGYAYEGACAALRFAFDVLQLPEVVAFTALINLRSQALMRRLGMSERVRERFSHPALPSGHVLSPHVLYRLPAPR